VVVRKAREAGRAPLSRGRVLAAAIQRADDEGLAAVTMRSLAADLGVEAMSLYHHLPGKEGLLDGLVESILDEIREQTAVDDTGPDDTGPDDTGTDAFDWRDAVRQRCLGARVVMVRHPWAPALITSRPSVPPSAYLHYEALLAEMIRGGLSYHLGHRALHALGSMVLGFVQEVFTPDPGEGAHDPEAAEADFAAFAAFVPHLAAMVASELHAADDDPLGWCDSQAEFEFTLDLILDGLHASSGDGGSPPM
jgi:AcrR family transcriptional regulator